MILSNNPAIVLAQAQVKDDEEQKGKIEENEILQDFFHGHALTVEMGEGKPNESEAKFHLSCYFANLVRLRNKDALSISQESELDENQTPLSFSPIPPTN